MSSRRRPILLSGFLAVGLGGIAVWGLQATAITRQGVNFAVSNCPIPLHVKILDFLHRNIHYRLLAQQITHGLTSDRERVLAAFDWTHRNIRTIPRGWPVVDDHILHIMIRGYGLDDQMADVFCTLATYAGVPAFWKLVRDVPGGSGLILSFAKVDGAWRVFDVAHRVVFTDPNGALLDIKALLADPTLAEVTDQQAGGIPYSQYLANLQPFTVPDVLRAQKQMPIPRLLYEVRRVVRWKGKE